MMGRGHMITGVCALEHAYVASILIDRVDIMPLTVLKDAAGTYLGIPGMSPFIIPVCLGAYLLGNLLPDIDDPKSLLGRVIHVPVRHRTWLHAIYLYLLVAALGFVHPVFSWMFFGIFVHLFWDSFSAMGNCWFYKLFSDYREYPNGARVKKGHKLKLYHAGCWSEYLLLFIIVAATMVSFIWIRRL